MSRPIASGRIAGAGTTPVGNGVIPARTGAGVYTWTLMGDNVGPAGDLAFSITPEGAAAASRAWYMLEHTSDSVKTVRFFDNAGAAIDIGHSLTAFRHF